MKIWRALFPLLILTCLRIISNMDSEQLIVHWVNSAEQDFITMNILFDNKRYMHSLFFGHLVIEKLLKGLYAKTHPKAPHAPKSHSLLFLADKCNLKVDDKKADILFTITSFNLDSRYEDEKQRFHKQCTKEFTAENVKIIKELREWLKTLIAK